MTFRKVCDGPADAIDAQYHDLVLADDKLFLFGQKGIKLHKHSFFHWTTLHGGVAFEFDLTKKKSEINKFSEVDIDEDSEDYVFSLDGVTYLMTYSHIGCIKFRELYAWNVEKSKWHSEGKFDDVDAPCEEPGGNKYHVAFFADKENHRLIVGFIGGEAAFQKKIKIVAVTPKDRKVHLLAAACIEDNNCELTHVALVDPNMAIAITGSVGCGFRWRPNRPILIDLTKKTTEVIEATGESGFSYGGSGFAFMTPKGNWVHVLGSRAHGMTGVEKLRDIAIFSPSEKSWSKSGIEIPSDLNLSETSAGLSAKKGEKLYLGDKKAVYEIDVAEFDK